MIQLFVVLIAIVVVASVALWAIRKAPDSVINPEFKGVLGWIIIVAAVIILLVKLFAHLNISI